MDITTYADDNYLVEFDRDIIATLGKVKMKSEFLIKWLTDSGLKVNSTKTEICIFYKNDIATQEIIINDVPIKTKKVMKILGLNFDSKLNWSYQVNSSISHAKTSLHAIRLLSKYLTREKLLTISNAYFYQRLYYGSQVWLNDNLNHSFKHKLFQASSSCLRICAKDYMRLFSYKELHVLFNRALPLQWSEYTLINTLFDILKTEKPDFLFSKLKINSIFHDRSNTFYIRPSNLTRVGQNCISNRAMKVMKIVNKNDWCLNKNQFKMAMKKKLLKPA